MTLSQTDAGLQQLLAEIMSSIVQYAERVKIDGMSEQQALTMRVDVASDDLPLLVGGGRANLRSIRTLLQAVGARKKRAVRIIVVGDGEEWTQEPGSC